MTYPYRNRWQRYGWLPRDGETREQWQARRNREYASGIEAQSAETPQEVRREGQEPDPKGDAQTPDFSGDSSNG